MQSTVKMKLRERKVDDLTAEKRRLVEVPYTASLAHTMNTLVANRVLAVPVAAPPGQWIGAGGSMIMEADKQSGAVRKQYIGMITMLDMLVHIAAAVDDHDHGKTVDLHQRMSMPVSAIIGHCMESLSLWTLNPNTSIVDCMEVFSKGIHRALVPIDSQMENVSGVELVESASSYRILTQMDVLRFFKGHTSEMTHFLSRPVKEFNVTDDVFAVTGRTKVTDAIKSMRAASLLAVPIIQELDTDDEDDHRQLLYGNGRKLIGTFSATDLRGCPISQLQTWLNLSVMEFTEKVVTSPLSEVPGLVNSPRELVTCYVESSLGEVIDKAVDKHVHRIWVVDHSGLLSGIVSLSDMIRVIRESILSE